jgi:two-component system invasion response regulator UvrY
MFKGVSIENFEHQILLTLVQSQGLVRNYCTAFLESAGDICVVLKADECNRMMQLISASSLQPHLHLIEQALISGSRQWDQVKQLSVDTPVLLLRNTDELNAAEDIGSGNQVYSVCTEHPEALKTAIMNLVQLSARSSRSRLASSVTNPTDEPVFNKVELALLRMSLSEIPYKELAANLNISVRSIESCCWRLFRKLKVRSRMGLARYAIAHGFVPVHPQSLHQQALLERFVENGRM